MALTGDVRGGVVANGAPSAIPEEVNVPFTHSVSGLRNTMLVVGEFISTGITVPGHGIEFFYPDGECVLLCECGWQSEIDSYPNPWVVVEVNSRIRRHLTEVGFSEKEESNYAE